MRFLQATSVAVLVCTAVPCLAKDEAATPRHADHAPEPEPEKVTPTAPVRPPDKDEVLVMSFIFNNALHRIRILHENEEEVLGEKLAGGTTRYRKKFLADIQRYQLSPQAYWEEVGDHYMDVVWERKDDLANYHKARSAYLKSLSHEEAPEVREKLKRLEAEREHMQRELMKLHQAAKAEHEAERARLEKERAEGELKALPELERAVKGQARQLRDVRKALRNIVKEMKEIEENIDDLEDRLQDLSRRRKNDD
jgi:hypothetical protein